MNRFSHLFPYLSTEIPPGSSRGFFHTFFLNVSSNILEGGKSLTDSILINKQTYFPLAEQQQRRRGISLHGIYAQEEKAKNKNSLGRRLSIREREKKKTPSLMTQRRTERNVNKGEQTWSRYAAAERTDDGVGGGWERTENKFSS